MMRIGDTFQLSASDLVGHLSCLNLTELQFDERMLVRVANTVIRTTPVGSPGAVAAEVSPWHFASPCATIPARWASSDMASSRRGCGFAIMVANVSADLAIEKPVLAALEGSCGHSGRDSRTSSAMPRRRLSS
jgi:hypothetical protein